jgi:ribokinase
MEKPYSPSDTMGVSFPVYPVHTTAAGDAFNGALAVASGRSDAKTDAVRFTNAVGALSTTCLDALSLLPIAIEVAS